MVFSTVTFLFYFLPLFLICYFALPKRNAVLLAASLVFYTWGEPQNLPLLLISTLLNYLFGLAIGREQAGGRPGKRVFVLGVVVNLVGLGYYKYFNFAFATLADFAVAWGFALPQTKHVALPLGISFFTFHAISYLADVFRKKTPPEKSLLALSMYIMMFPQLIAGPIIRFATIARQLHKRHHTVGRIHIGLKLFIVGLAQKVLIANTVALCADQIFSLPSDILSTSTAWLGAVCYTLQIYFDFFGYSNMAIGLGLVTGFTFPRNFNYPYISQSITEFWQRWHLSLSRWFRDYVYIPLGGNRVSPWRTYLNLYIVFFLCGLWHGASWTFVAWGLYHGTFLVIERAGLKNTLQRLPGILRHLYAMLVVITGWVFFRCDSFSQVTAFIKAMTGGAPLDTQAAPVMSFVSGALVAALVIGVAMSIPVTKWFAAFSAKFMGNWSEGVRQQQHLVDAAAQVLIGAMYMVLMALSTISLASGAYNPFIYFRF